MISTVGPTERIGDLRLDLKREVGRFALEAAHGEAREVACFGARGDGKTVGALITMILHVGFFL